MRFAEKYADDLLTREQFTNRDAKAASRRAGVEVRIIKRKGAATLGGTGLGRMDVTEGWADLSDD